MCAQTSRGVSNSSTVVSFFFRLFVAARDGGHAEHVRRQHLTSLQLQMSIGSSRTRPCCMLISRLFIQCFRFSVCCFPLFPLSHTHEPTTADSMASDHPAVDHTAKDACLRSPDWRSPPSSWAFAASVLQLLGGVVIAASVAPLLPVGNEAAGHAKGSTKS